MYQSSVGHRYILVVSDYATRYQEAFLLRTITTPKILALVLLFSRVGIPKEILTDQGTNFTSPVKRPVLCPSGAGLPCNLSLSYLLLSDASLWISWGVWKEQIWQGEVAREPCPAGTQHWSFDRWRMWCNMSVHQNIVWASERVSECVHAFSAGPGGHPRGQCVLNVKQ